MVMRFMQLGVRARLYAGFGVLGVAVAALAIQEQVQVRSQLVITNATSRNLTALDEVALKLESIRRAALRFEVDSDQAALSSVREDLDQIQEMAGGSALSRLPEDLQQVYRSVRQALQVYRDQFDRLVQLQKTSTTLRDMLSAGSAKLSDDVARLGKQTLVATEPRIDEAAESFVHAIVGLRRDGQGFIASGDLGWQPTIMVDCQVAMDKFRALENLADSPVGPTAAALATSLEAIKRYFDESFATTSEIRKLYYGAMIPGIIAIQDQIRQPRQALQAHLVEATRVSGQMLSTATRLHLIIAFCIPVLGAVGVFLLGRSILTPLIAMTRTMTRLAGGDTSVIVPAGSNRDEIGDMARAVEVFRLNKVRADGLAAQKAENDARKVARQDDMDQMSEGFSASMSKIMNTLMESASGMYHAAGEMTAASASMHRGILHDIGWRTTGVG